MQKQSMRMSMLSQSELVASKRRFGLFNQPLPTALGDDSLFPSKIHPKDEMGKPLTQPRNFYVSPIKTGRTDKSYFGKMNSLSTHSQHDIFLQEGSRLIKQQYEKFQKGRKQVNFFPAAGPKSLTNSSYKYVEQKDPQKDPKRYRVQDGRVYTKSPNINTSPQSKLYYSFLKSCKYVQDPYQRAQDQQSLRLKQEKSKERQEVFKPNHFSAQLFTNNRKIYGIQDISLPQIKVSKEQESSFKPEQVWKSMVCPKKGIKGMFTPVHRYIENPPVQRKRSSNIKSEREAMKAMGSMLSTPSPSISLNKVNMMGSIRRIMSPKR